MILLASFLTLAALAASGQQEIRIESVEFAGELAGVVMAYGDVPLKEVEVSEIGKDSKAVRTVLTDSSGHFDLGKAERGVYTLRLRGPGLNIYWYRVRVSPKTKATLKLMMSVAD